ncbi:MORN repeat-containing protein 3 isoform X3 [Pipistrellus kuhlii]|uniref:MORN repeat-containing protein 3 isoform X3 n=1 Tax=Pipistrellus kuhlii TaxID=59472 RepID=UPI001E27158F|nr:MORN repeat-containing protein 3 isoform X3 [Pipistrellus kuhlii]
MPISKCPPKSQPPWKEWDQKAQKNGLRHQVHAVNGDRYVGEWKDNMKHGKGTQIWKKKGTIYEGDWKFGKRDGYGTLSRPDKEKGKYRKVYSGWWKGDKKSGYGIQFYGPNEYYEENGNRYEGYWQGGLKNGPGRFFHLDHGQLFEGFWVDNIAKCGTMTDFGRDEAPEPTQFPIPQVEVVDPDGVLEEALAMVKKKDEPSEAGTKRSRDSQSFRRKSSPHHPTAQTGGGVSGDSGHTLGIHREHLILPALDPPLSIGASASLPSWPWGSSCYSFYSRPLSLSAGE